METLPPVTELKEWRQLLLWNQFALDEMTTKLKILNEECQHHDEGTPIEHIKSRVKSLESIAKKLERKKQPFTAEAAKAHIHDLAGVRVICSFTSDIENIFMMLSQQNDINVIKIKDYVTNPKANGYRSFHMIVEIPIFLKEGMQLMRVEIQLRTIAMDFWASLEHKIYYKFDQVVPDGLIAELTSTAAIVNELDDRMLSINRRIKH
ncbi:GTP pyrophosphokinase [Brochothrix campestris]|uniref:RelA/SpoT domain-containing protein n=1 Tax=Brochothrix campestris FSL F6-1037 TaxID=1265861 RepID=W7D7L3_9LIST|nr:GTP pyrophosphokinase family protein [Brochothrix campestris]EUJ41343.1 RelA/SpoT domain-containing protein [Brochothrix campestris FSL F6-1037]